MQFLLLLALTATVSPFIIFKNQNPTLLHGVLCQPCVNIITNGENNAEGDFDTWFDKETAKVCSDLGFLKQECMQYFKEYEEEINHFITVKADPKESCQKIDFCN